MKTRETNPGAPPRRTCSDGTLGGNMKSGDTHDRTTTTIVTRRSPA